METLQVKILDPKAKNLLKNLADLKLIKIKDSSKVTEELLTYLNETRQDNVPSLEDIQKEIEIVRAEMQSQ